MSNVKISLWAIAIVGFAVVIFLYFFISNRFNETTSYDNEATTTGIYLDNEQPLLLASAVEQKRILVWIKQNNLNQYGDPITTSYAAGAPLSPNGHKQYVNRFHYIIAKHPDRPWNAGTAVDEKVLIDKWIAANNLNAFGDSDATTYSGGTPLFDETTGQTKDKYVYIMAAHHDRPWAQVKTGATPTTK